MPHVCQGTGKHRQVGRVCWSRVTGGLLHGVFCVVCGRWGNLLTLRNYAGHDHIFTKSLFCRFYTGSQNYALSTFRHSHSNSRRYASTAFLGTSSSMPVEGMREHEESRPTRSRTAFREYVRTLSLVLCRTTSVAWLTGAGCSGQGRQHFQYPLVDPMCQSGWLCFVGRAWSGY